MKKLLDMPARGALRKTGPFRPKASALGAMKEFEKFGLLRGAIGEFASHYKISRETLTRITGFSPRAVANWSQGNKPSSSTTRRLVEVERLFGALEKLVSAEAIGPWLMDPNPAFDGSTPLQVIERGETDRIWRMVHELESG